MTALKRQRTLVLVLETFSEMELSLSVRIARSRDSKQRLSLRGC